MNTRPSILLTRKSFWEILGNNWKKILIFLLAVSPYVFFLDSRGTHNTFDFINWIGEFREGNFYSLYHVSESARNYQEKNLIVPYPPFSLYLLGAVSFITELMVGSKDSAYLIASNFTGSFFTIMTYLLLLNYLRKQQAIKPIYYLLNPTVFLLCPILGYQDSIMSFFLVSSLMSLERRKFYSAGILAGFAVFSKQLAVMPILACFLLLVLITNFVYIKKFIIGFFVSLTISLFPFIINGTLLLYFKAQSLASVHTMLSAQNPNIPWLLSCIIRALKFGLFNEETYSGVPFRLEDNFLRQFIYLVSGVLFLAVVTLWIIIWKKKIEAEKISPLHAGLVGILTYNMVNMGVHENHVFMALPILATLTTSKKIREAYFLISIALGLNLLATGGLGLSFPSFPTLLTSKPVLYTALGSICLFMQIRAFVIVLTANPQIKAVENQLQVASLKPKHSDQ